jgi:hypothetical protein
MRDLRSGQRLATRSRVAQSTVERGADGSRKLVFASAELVQKRGVKTRLGLVASR